MEVTKRGAPLKPAHSDPLKQAKREKERLARQGSRERAAQRAVVAKETGVALLTPRRGPTPLPDEQVSRGHQQKRARLAVKAAAAAVTAARLPDFAVAATAIESMVETSVVENAAATQAAAEQAAAEQAAVEAAIKVAIEAAATEAAAAEIEVAIEQAAASMVAERAEAIGEAVEGMLASLEKAEAERLRLERRLARELMADRGFVDEARSRSDARIDLTCFICMDVDSHADAYMPCCLHRVHRACIQRWHSMGQDKTKHQISAPKQGGGWKPVAMARVHGCPHCRSERLSARVPRV